VGTERPDDAGVYRVRDDLALILTVDFFTPVVDDPREFGEIAAANALSDVYAMGGEPFAALNIAGFPAACGELPLSVLGDVLAGGAAKAEEAGVVIIGGHTIDDPEPKYGLAVIGRIHPDRLVLKGGARPGDQLVLTKPLGTGIVTTALKQRKIDEAHAAEAIRVMATLNREAARAMTACGVRAATDVTGFGLLGHLGEMLRQDHLGARLEAASLPFLAGARELARVGAIPGGTQRNLTLAAERTSFGDGVGEAEQLLLADAQTSGGLLIAVPPEKTETLLAELAQRATPAAARIGEITDSPGIRVD
jgi:selenide,water dikinase